MCKKYPASTRLSAVQSVCTLRVLNVITNIQNAGIDAASFLSSVCTVSMS